MSIQSIIQSILLGSQAVNNLTQALTNATTLSMPNITSLNFTAATATFGFVETTLGWQTYTPAITPASGTLTSSSASGQYYQLAPTGGLWFINVDVTITTVGTTNPPIIVPLPAAFTAVIQSALSFSDGNGDAGWAFANSGSNMRFAPVTPNSTLTNNTLYIISGFVRT